jgi:predicted DNA-binding mobile mystery protein A
MRATERAIARQQLDKRLKIIDKIDSLSTPPRGWVRAIREALGMTAAQLAKRMGVSQVRALAVEKSEARGSITLDSLDRAAQALECRLVYVLIPRKPLEELVQERANLLARDRLRATRHTMALEAQSVDTADEQEQLNRLTRELAANAGARLWDTR